MQFFKQTFKSQSAQAGFSLVEILIALTLMGIAGTFVVGKLYERLQEGQVQSAKIQIKGLGDRLRDFKRHCGYYPSTEQGLDALIEAPTTGRECKRYAPGGYIDGGKIPLDPWDNEYMYESDGRNYTIISLGNDGIEGGEGSDADISSADI